MNAIHNFLHVDCFKGIANMQRASHEADQDMPPARILDRRVEEATTQPSVKNLERLDKG